MKYDHDKSRAAPLSEQALKRLEEEDLPPTPENYELWYAYYANVSPEVKRAINILVDNEQDITQERCTEIYQRFLSTAQTEDVVRKAGDKIQSTLEEMAEFMAGVKSNTSSFTGTLESATEQINTANSLEEIETMMKDLVRDTETMLEHNKRLEQELDRSSTEMIELQNNLETIRKEAYTDGLTGLKNRKAFDEDLDTAIQQSSEDEETEFALLMLDIDHFKEFNDNYGHQVGDQVLRLVAKTLTDGIKGRDTAYRFGGEEFVIILPNTGDKGGTAVAEALRKSIGDKEIVNKHSQEKLGKITISIGVAAHQKDEDDESLIERADAALYTAKRSGRNRVAVAPVKNAKSDKEKKVG